MMLIPQSVNMFPLLTCLSFHGDKASNEPCESLGILNFRSCKIRKHKCDHKLAYKWLDRTFDLRGFNATEFDFASYCISTIFNHFAL